MDATVTYVIEHHYGRAHLKKAKTDEEALEAFARTKAKAKWGIKPTLVKETREVLAVQDA